MGSWKTYPGLSWCFPFQLCECFVFPVQVEVDITISSKYSSKKIIYLGNRLWFLKICKYYTEMIYIEILETETQHERWVIKSSLFSRRQYRIMDDVPSKHHFRFPTSHNMCTMRYPTGSPGGTMAITSVFQRSMKLSWCKGSEDVVGFWRDGSDFEYLSLCRFRSYIDISI